MSPNSSGSSSRRWPRLAGSLALACASVALTLALAEAAVRRLAPGWRPLVAERALFWRHHEVRGWAHDPGTSGRFVGPSWDVSVEINRLGLRGPEPAEPPAGPRWLLLGDSFGWGFGVEAEHAVAAVLAEACPGREVINGSVSGYSTDQEYLYYRDEGTRLRPERVVLLIHENDLPGNSSRRMYGYEKPRFVAVGGGLELENVPVPERRAWERAYGALTSRSWLAHRILRQPRIAMMLEFGLPFGADELPVDLEVTRRLLARFARELERERIAFHWALVPMREDRARSLGQLGRRLGVPVLDLAPAFERARSEGRALTLPGDAHWNAAGHRVAGEALAAHLGCARD